MLLKKIPLFMNNLIVNEIKNYVSYSRFDCQLNNAKTVKAGN